MCITVVNVKNLRTHDQRAGVCYVGRAFAGWPASPWGNPHKGQYALANFAGWLTNHPDREKLLADLWEACEHGAKPLGCWCVPEPWPVNLDHQHVCHAQILAVELLLKFGPRHLAFPGVPDGWKCPRYEPPAAGQRCDLIAKDGRIHPGLTYRRGQFLIRDFSPWDGNAVGWRPSPTPDETPPRRNN